MSRSISASALSRPVRTLDAIRPTEHPPLKPGSVPVVASDQIGLLAWSALVKHYGSVKEAAYALGEGAGLQPLDPSLLRREVEDGKFGRLGVDPGAVAAVAVALTEAYAELSSPKARARAAIRDIRRRCDELEQFLEFVA